jgi:hypothetical protein
LTSIGASKSATADYLSKLKQENLPEEAETWSQYLGKNE